MHDWMEDARSMLNFAMFLTNNNRTSLTSCVQESVLEGNQKDVIRPKVILVGSSMGAWIAVQLALEQPHLITGVIGIGSAIDFTYHTYQRLTVEQQDTFPYNGTVDISSPYLDEPFPFSKALYESGNNYLLCHDARAKNEDSSDSDYPLKLLCPVRFLHGSKDDVVHWSIVTSAVEFLQSKYYAEDISAQLLDGGDHRLSRPEDISVFLETLDDLL